MFRTDAPANAPAKPAYAPIGVAGYYQDTDPAGGTEITADWLNHVQEELCQLILWAGYALDKADDTQLRTVMQAKTDGIISHATDTGTSTTVHKTAIIASNSSRAAGTDAACLACAGSIAHDDATAAIAGIGTIVSKAGSAVFGKYCELSEYNAIGGGYAVGAVVETDANQNLTWLVTLQDGTEHAKVFKAGDPNAKTAKVTLDGATGNIDADGDLTAGGSLDIGASKFTVDGGTGNINTIGDVLINTDKVIIESTTGDISSKGWIGTVGGFKTDYTLGAMSGSPYTINKPSGSGGILALAPATWAVGLAGEINWIVNNNKVGADSQVYVTGYCSDAGTTPVFGLKALGVGQFTVFAQNLGNVSGPGYTVVFYFHVLQPV